MIAVQVGARLGDVDAVLRNSDCGYGMIKVGSNLPKVPVDISVTFTFQLNIITDFTTSN